jgi:hypothetical protein
MDKKQRSKMEDALLGALSLPEIKTEKGVPKNLVIEKMAGTTKKRSQTAAISLLPEDSKKIGELKMWFLSQGIKVSDSMIIRCALWMTPAGKEIFDIYQKAKVLDQRGKR